MLVYELNFAARAAAKEMQKTFGRRNRLRSSRVRAAAAYVDADTNAEKADIRQEEIETLNFLVRGKKKLERRADLCKSLILLLDAGQSSVSSSYSVLELFFMKAGELRGVVNDLAPFVGDVSVFHTFLDEVENQDMKNEDDEAARKDAKLHWWQRVGRRVAQSVNAWFQKIFRSNTGLGIDSAAAPGMNIKEQMASHAVVAATLKGSASALYSHVDAEVTKDDSTETR